jgi:hypothetical protein
VADWRLVRLTDADERMLGYERLLFEHLFSWWLSGPARSFVPLSSLKTEFASRYHRVERALYAEAMRRGWFTDRPDRAYRNGWWTGVAVTVVGAVLIVPAAAFTRLGLVPIPMVVLGLALVIGARWMPRRTVTGSMLRDRVLAFRDYLRTTAFVDPAGAASGAVAPYLGYAMVFDLTEQWRTALTVTTATAGSTGAADDPAWPPSFAAHTDDFSRTSNRALGGTTSRFGAAGSSGRSSGRGGSSTGGSSSGGSWTPRAGPGGGRTGAPAGPGQPALGLPQNRRGVPQARRHGVRDVGAHHPAPAPPRPGTPPRRSQLDGVPPRASLCNVGV